MLGDLARAWALGGPAEVVAVALAVLGLVPCLALRGRARAGRGAIAAWTAGATCALLLGVAAALFRADLAHDAVARSPAREQAAEAAAGAAVAAAGVGVATTAAALGLLAASALGWWGGPPEHLARRRRLVLVGLAMALVAAAAGGGPLVLLGLVLLAAAGAGHPGAPALPLAALGVVWLAGAERWVDLARTCDLLVLVEPERDVPRLAGALAASRPLGGVIALVAALVVAVLAPERPAGSWRVVGALAVASVVLHGLVARATSAVLDLGASPALRGLEARVGLPTLALSAADATSRIASGCLYTAVGATWVATELSAGACDPSAARDPLVAVAAGATARSLSTAPASAGGSFEVVAALPGRWPSAADPWRYARVKVWTVDAPVAREGAWVWPGNRGPQEGPAALLERPEGDVLVGPGGRAPYDPSDAEALAAALSHRARVDVVLVPGPTWTARDLVDRCARLREVKPRGTRCLLGTGAAEQWWAWGSSARGAATDAGRDPPR